MRNKRLMFLKHGAALDRSRSQILDRNEVRELGLERLRRKTKSLSFSESKRLVLIGDQGETESKLRMLNNRNMGVNKTCLFVVSNKGNFPCPLLLRRFRGRLSIVLWHGTPTENKVQSTADFCYCRLPELHRCIRLQGVTKLIFPSRFWEIGL